MFSALHDKFVKTQTLKIVSRNGHIIRDTPLTYRKQNILNNSVPTVDIATYKT